VDYNILLGGAPVSLARNSSANFPKTPSPKPARIPPQTPPAGGKSAEAGRIQNPKQIVSPCRVLFSSFNHLDFARNSFELCPTNTATYYEKPSTPFGVESGFNNYFNTNSISK